MYLGIDFGTSGCRAQVINARNETAASVSTPLPSSQSIDSSITQHPGDWLDGLHTLFNRLSSQCDLKQIQRIAIDGTSGSILLSDHQGNPLSHALMYNDVSSHNEVLLIKHACPASQHLCMNASSGLAKAIQLLAQQHREDLLILCQADFITCTLSQNWGVSDYHNALKLGYDVIQDCWPDWLADIVKPECLPQVFEPGQVIGRIQADWINRYGFSEQCDICAGTTDANAAFIASGSTRPGDAVTSLGSSLVIKILNDHAVEELTSGIYSHRLGDYWLCSGASNAGAAILRDYFSDQQIETLSKQINPEISSTLDYYPLRQVGERFPHYDPQRQPCLQPRPESDVEFLHGLLESLARIEQQGYQKLGVLGATEPCRIQTAGGGAQNPQWQAIRQRLLGKPVIRAQHTEAAYGSALIAHHGLNPFKRDVNQ